ncbi:MAG TPA: hypothetical protein VF331_02005 [Polyangiales bacterium]
MFAKTALVVMVALGLALSVRGVRAPVAQRPHGSVTQAQPQSAPPGAPVHAPRRVAVAAPPVPAHVHTLAIGGGPSPEFTEVSLEQDLDLARRVLPGPGLVFFAGGADALSVRTLDPSIDEQALLSRLGELFEPRGSRGSRYRKTTLPALPATLDEIETQLGRALADGKEPLLVYIAAHGEQGKHERDNHVALWGGESLGVARVAQLQATRTRPLRLVIASCFSGGFAELAFQDAQPSKGVTQVPRCGLFAGTWDRETSGCDPNPDRRAQESYSLHMLHALRSQDRDGQALARADIDFDGDGKVSLLEAHTRARIASTSIDVPTTTSERYLREVQKTRGPLDRALSLEEAAVITGLGARLGLLTQAATSQRLQQLQQQLDAADAQLAAAEDAAVHPHAALSGLLLSRWPMLDDPYHPDFAATLAKDGPSIRKVLDDSAEAKVYDDAEDRVDELQAEYWALQTQESVVLRLSRAYETLELAAALRARGGAQWQGYQRLLACERGAP